MSDNYSPNNMLTIIITLCICYILLFLLAYYLKDNSIVDVFWWAGFLIISCILLHQNYWQELSLTQVVSFILILLWSVRIVYNIGRKKVFHRGEDKRYAKWRSEWKYFYTRSFFQIYLLQMLLMLIVATPLFVIFTWEWENIFFTLSWWIIALIWLMYEAIADKQLQNFLLLKDRPKNVIFTKWLWAYSRHPNYLWEIVFWLGITLVSLQFSLWWIIWFILLTGLLLFVSWVPFKEESYKRKDNYEEYVRSTAKFIPRFLKWNSFT